MRNRIDIATRLWLMRRMPWELLHWLTMRRGWCWSDVVSIKIGHRDADDYPDGIDLKPSWSCFEGHPEPFDYCGHYDESHPCFRAVLAARYRQEHKETPK